MQHISGRGRNQVNEEGQLVGQVPINALTGQLALPRFHISGNRGNQDLRRQLMAHAEVPLSMSAKMF